MTETLTPSSNCLNFWNCNEKLVYLFYGNHNFLNCYGNCGVFSQLWLKHSLPALNAWIFKIVIRNLYIFVWNHNFQNYHNNYGVFSQFSQIMTKSHTPSSKCPNFQSFNQIGTTIVELHSVANFCSWSSYEVKCNIYDNSRTNFPTWLLEGVGLYVNKARDTLET